MLFQTSHRSSLQSLLLCTTSVDTISNEWNTEVGYVTGLSVTGISLYYHYHHIGYGGES